ncbi:hypothetical protein ACK3TF_005678 [Chlorella vulgaris]
MQIDQQNWAAQAAHWIVTRGHFPAAAAAGLHSIFHDDHTVTLVLATGKGEFEAFDLHPKPHAAVFTMPFSASSATQQAVSSGVTGIDDTTPNRYLLRDWQQLHEAHGIQWLLAAPLGSSKSGTCQEHQRASLGYREHRTTLGAVLVGGQGPAPTIDAVWLSEWALEMGDLISHTSVQLMECSLHMLGVTFPPRVVESLVLNAASKKGQTNLAAALREALAQHASGASNSPGSNNHDGSTAPGTVSGSARCSLESQAPRAASTFPAGVPYRHLRMPAAQTASPPVASPFAAPPHGTVAPFTTGPPPPASCTERDVCTASPNPSTLSASAAAMLLSQVSRGSTASAILRQVSLQSNLSHLYEGESQLPSSPRMWEVEGYEDILEEDQRITQNRRPSLSLDRAHSNPAHAAALTPSQVLPSVEACMDAAGSIQAAVQQADASTSVHAAAAASYHAADQPGTAAVEEAGTVGGSELEGVERIEEQGVHVCRLEHPLHNQLSSEEVEACPATESSKAAAVPEPVDAGSSRGADYGGGEGAAGKQPAQRISTACNPASVSLTGTAARYRSESEPEPTAPATQQAWDLRFSSAALEDCYKRWLAPCLLRGDISLGIVHLLVAAAALLRMLMLQWGGWANLLPLAGLLLVAVPALPAAFRPAWWASHRTASIVTLRLLATAAAAAQLFAVSAASADPAGEAASQPPASHAGMVLSHSGAVWLCLLPLRLPLPFSLHLPLHLACIWIVTAATSLTNACRTGTTLPAAGLSLPAAMAAQLLVGFLAPSLVVRCCEASLRSRFLGTRQPALCLDFLQRRRIPRPAPAPLNS